MTSAEHVGQQFRQLPMFMTAREIMEQYQPLDGDRAPLVPPAEAPRTYVPQVHPGGAHMSDYSGTLTEGGGIPSSRRPQHRPPAVELDPYAERTRAEISLGLRETDEQLWRRKVDQAKWKDPPKGSPEWNLYHSVLNEGMNNPVSLQVDPHLVGSQGKPEVLGGHHRLATMADAKPDVLIPVSHFRGVGEAKRVLGPIY